jgi:hypothetical protein
MVSSAERVSDAPAKRSLLWLLASGYYGGILAAASALGIDFKTLSRACQGASVSKVTRGKLEKAFGYPLERMQLPIDQVLKDSSQ